MMPGGARLQAVYGDRVLIERNGSLETLKLPRTPMQRRPAHQSAAAGERGACGAA